MTNLSPPPSRIYLLRHARSGWALPGQRDFDRTLDDTGQSDAERVAHHAAKKDYRPGRVLCSTAMRCRQTAQAILRAFGPQLEIRFIDELYNGSVSTYLDILDGQDDVQSVMLVGHNPTMEEVLEKLVGHKAAHRALPDGYPTAGLAVLDHNGDAAKTMKHAWALTDMLHR